jgi:hypothetical protein
VTTKEQLQNFRDELQNGSSKVCGDSPKWLRDELLVRLDRLLDEASDETIREKIASFSLGAIRYVSDRCGSECDALLEAISALE